MRGGMAMRGGGDGMRDAHGPRGNGMGGGPPAKRGRWESGPTSFSSESYYGGNQDYSSPGGYNEGYGGGAAPVSRSSFHQDPYGSSDMVNNGYQQGVGGGYGEQPAAGGYDSGYGKPDDRSADYNSSGIGNGGGGGYASSYGDRGYGGRQPAETGYGGGGPDRYSSYDNYGGSSYGQSRDSYGGGGHY